MNGLTNSAVVISPCCFKPTGSKTLCQTTLSRLEAALTLPGKFVILLGDVPKTSQSLAAAMQAWLAAHDFRKPIIIERAGVETISDCQGAMQIAKRMQIHHLTWVTSTWHMEYGQPIWEYFTKKAGLGLILHPVQDTAGAKTRNFYHQLAKLSRLVFAAPWRYCGAPQIFSLAAYLAARGRRQSFNQNGCE